MSILENIKIVLVNTSHPGNIGSAARAMKTMGLTKLCLVGPKHFPDARATELASNASDVLQKAQVVDSIDEAIAGCELIMGSSARLRKIPWPMKTAREGAIDALQHAQHAKVAILFGREDSGLTNEELQLCHVHINIPGNPEYDVLNLAQAVQIVAYECQMAMLGGDVPQKEYEPLAKAEEIKGFYEHLERTLTDLSFYNPKAPKQLLPRVKRLFARLRLERQEVNILRGLLTSIDDVIKK